MLKNGNFNRTAHPQGQRQGRISLLGPLALPPPRRGVGWAALGLVGSGQGPTGEADSDGAVLEKAKRGGCADAEGWPSRWWTGGGGLAVSAGDAQDTWSTSDFFQVADNCCGKK